MYCWMKFWKNEKSESKKVYCDRKKFMKDNTLTNDTTKLKKKHLLEMILLL